MQLIRDVIKYLFIFTLLISVSVGAKVKKSKTVETLLKIAKNSPIIFRDNGKKLTTLLRWNNGAKNSGTLSLRILNSDGRDLLFVKKDIKQITLQKILEIKNFTLSMSKGVKLHTVSTFENIQNKELNSVTPTLKIKLSGFATTKNNIPETISLKHQIDIASINLLQFWDNNPNNTKEEQLYIYDLFRPGFSNWYNPEIYKAKIDNLIQTVRIMKLPEIIGMQELESAGNNSEIFSKSGPLYIELKKLGYNYFYLGTQEETNPVALTTGFISKYKILNSSIPLNTSIKQFKDFSGRNKKTAAYTTRDIQVATLNLGEKKLKIYNNHWRSQGCGSPSSCTFSLNVRIASAKLLLEKVNKELKKDPLLDIIMLGDFNCNYLDKPLKVFGPTHDEKAIQMKKGSIGLYNLWYELPKDKRWEASHNGRASTLSHVFINNSLYDSVGFQYKDNSFYVVGHTKEAKKLLMNVDGSPFRWQEKRLKLDKASAKAKKQIAKVIDIRDCNGKRARHKRCRPIYTEFTGVGFGDHLPLVTSLYFVGNAHERVMTKFPPTSHGVTTELPLINVNPHYCKSFTEITSKINFKKAKGQCVSLNFSKSPLPLQQAGIYKTAYISLYGQNLGLSIVRSFDPRPINNNMPSASKNKYMHNESNMCFARKILQGKGGAIKTAKGVIGFQNGIPTLFATTRSDFSLVDLPTSKKNSCKKNNDPQETFER